MHQDDLPPVGGPGQAFFTADPPTAEEVARLISEFGSHDEPKQSRVGGVQTVAVTDEEDDCLVFFRMRLARNNFKFSQAKASMLKRGANYRMTLGDKVVFRALKGHYQVTTLFIAEENVDRLLDELNTIKDIRRPALVFVGSKEFFFSVLGMQVNVTQAVAAVVDQQNLKPELGLSEIRNHILSPYLREDDDYNSIASQVARGEEICIVHALQAPILVLQDVRSADNIGVLSRTAWSFGVKTLVVTPTTAAGVNARAARVSMGAVYHLSVYETPDLAKDLKRLNSGGVSVIGTSPKGEGMIMSHPDKNWALLLGNEQNGCTEEVMESCSKQVRIPQVCGDSLSVSHAAAICLYELNRSTLHQGERIAPES